MLVVGLGRTVAALVVGHGGAVVARRVLGVGDGGAVVALGLGAGGVGAGVEVGGGWVVGGWGAGLRGCWSEGGGGGGGEGERTCLLGIAEGGWGGSRGGEFVMVADDWRGGYAQCVGRGKMMCRWMGGCMDLKVWKDGFEDWADIESSEGWCDAEELRPAASARVAMDVQKIRAGSEPYSDGQRRPQYRI